MTGSVNHDQHFKNLIADYLCEAVERLPPESPAAVTGRLLQMDCHFSGCNL